jgi:hypothetical protein
MCHFIICCYVPEHMPPAYLLSDIWNSPMVCGCESLNRMKILPLCGLKPWLSCSSICNQKISSLLFVMFLTTLSLKSLIIRRTQRFTCLSPTSQKPTSVFCHCFPRDSHLLLSVCIYCFTLLKYMFHITTSNPKLISERYEVLMDVLP